MKKIIHNNINPPYSLHDMSITAFDVTNAKITMRSDTGMVNTAPPYTQVDGYVEFYDVQWDFSYVYLLSETGNISRISLRDSLSLVFQLWMKHLDTIRPSTAVFFWEIVSITNVSWRSTTQVIEFS